MEPPPLPPRRAVPPPPSRQSSSSSPLSKLPGMSDDTLYSLLRRFNKQVTAIRAAEIPPTRLDFSPAPDEAFDPDKLRSNVERIYLTVVKDLMTLGKHLMLLRSWDNPMRTGSFASAYFIAWQSPFGAVSFLFLILALLILYPSVRTFLFPPLPTPRPSQVLVDKPPRDPTLTSAEQDEVDARVFAEGMAQLAGAGQMSGGDPTLEDVVNEAVEEAEIDVEVDEEEGASASEEKKKRKKEKKKKDKVDHLAKVGLPIQLLTSDFADSWERWGNALSPTSPPLHPNAARMKVALHVLPCILAFGLLPSWFICKALSFLAGLAFFGDPGFSLLLALLDQKFEGWKEAIELRHSMLDLVPSNTQLAVALLRDAETAGSPIPPPPPLPLKSAKGASVPPPLPARPLTTNGNEDEPPLAFPVAEEELTASDTASLASPTASRKSGKEKFASFVKTATKLTEEGAGYLGGERKLDWQKVSRVAVDKIKAKTGSDLPEHFMSIVPRNAPMDDRSNSTYLASSSNTPGHLLLLPPIHPTTLIFRPIATGPSHLTLTIPLASLISLRKTAGLGWKGRMALGWTTGVGNVGDGVKVGWTEVDEEGVVSEREKGFTAIVRRDELYNRVVGCAPGRFVLL